MPKCHQNHVEGQSNWSVNSSNQRTRLTIFLGMLVTLAGPLRRPVDCAPPDLTANVVVYRESGRFAGWPANNGIWSWGDEIVVGFTLGYHKDQDGHTIDGDRPSTSMQARSLDGGQHWTIEKRTLGNQPHINFQPIDFTQPGFAALLRSGNFYYSQDRGKQWKGPIVLPTFGRPGLLARTDYIVEGKHQLTAFIAAEKESGKEGQPLCIRTEDGGQTWQPIGWIGKQPPSNYGYAIMPATVALNEHSYLTMIRRGGVFDGERRWWIEPFLSPDAGKSWYMLDQPRIDNAGNPATLTRLFDGRLALAYGWRHAPYGIRARLSDDNGQTWGDELVLRTDGRTWDLGYPRTVQRLDGRLVTVYYFNDHQQKERYIAATIWDPNQTND